MSSIQTRLSSPPSFNVDSSSNQGGSGGGGMYFAQEEEQEQQQQPFFDFDNFYDFDDDSQNAYTPPPMRPLDKLILPLKIAAAVRLYTNFPKNYEAIENN